MFMRSQILDPCCGSRMFYFDKQHKNVLFQDIREEIIELHGRKPTVIAPDCIGDFTDMEYKDESFYLVIFDPPHLKWAGQKSFMRAKYGQLNDNWPEQLSKGFTECWRVLKPGGTLVFKWSDAQIKINDVLKLFGQQPVFGNRGR